MIDPTENLRLLPLVWGLLLLGALGIAFMLAIQLVSPLRRLTETTRQLAMGRLDTPVEVKGTREVEELASSVKAVVRDLLESREQLTLSEARYQAIVETMNEGVMLLDAQGNVGFCNGRMAAMAGHPPAEMIGRKAPEMLPPGRWDELQHHLKSPATFETELLDRGGSPWPVLASTAPIRNSNNGHAFQGALVVVADLREVRHLRQQVETAERLAIVGRLAFTLAHELRNPLGVISNSAYYLKTRCDQSDEKVQRHLDILRDQVVVSSQIVEQLLDYARPKDPVPVLVKLGRLIDVVLGQIQVPSSVQVVKDMGKTSQEVRVDPEMMQRVFWNLIQNAFQAMPEGGTLEIADRSDDTWVAVAIRDTGYGIPPANLSRIFEPLFTTKAKGTGLGLVVSRNTVERHGGSIDVESTLGKGAAFTVRLPRAGWKEEHGSQI
ncbi:MAG: hypothetical protein HW388_1721 [Dehalococcoidia bacterium]|nr:hypothetical protein [Dehalococcoidia bacterium]